mmetsp:Transcript_27427/g.59970  ORF Transcript_27427/g.59970 Transcript_27427/m.59970 type:complete len:515 (-) Transcript_27427:203-1747(-)
MSLDNLQTLLEKAVRESLREIALNVADEDGGRPTSQPPRSLESIVQEAAARTLAECSGRMRSSSTFGAAKNTTPLLSELSNTPWLVWRQAFHEASSYSFTSAPSAPMPTSSSGSPVGQTFAEFPEGEAAEEGKASSAASRRKLLQRRYSWGAASDEGTSFMKEADDVAAPGKRRERKENAVLVRKGLTIVSNASQHLMMRWQHPPKNFLLIGKKEDVHATAALIEMATWLSSRGFTVVLEHALLADQPHIRTVLPDALTFSQADPLEQSIDLVITIGGDGTLTWAVSLFGAGMPPLMSFAAGSLGFLTPFPLSACTRTLARVLDASQNGTPWPLVCRMRLKVEVRQRCPEGRQEDTITTLQCLNEVLVHRGASGALTKLDVSVDGERVTLVQGDGLILATPTGSTAYSLAAGGSIVHPGVPAILLTPVSPHSLSFRPALLPDSAVVTVKVPLSARHGAALSADGKDICMLSYGDSVEVRMSAWPVPTLCAGTETEDWFASCNRALRWNLREEQK